MTDGTALARMIEPIDGHHVRRPSEARMSIEVFSAETGGAYSLMETVLPPGGTAPLHIHEDENNFMLEGELSMRIGDAIYMAKAGSYVAAPGKPSAEALAELQRKYKLRCLPAA